MSAVRKWALGGMICAAIALFVFATVFITGDMPGAKVLGIIGYAFVAMEMFGLFIFKPWQDGPPHSGTPP